MLDQISQFKIEIEQCFDSKKHLNKGLKKILNFIAEFFNSDVLFTEENEDFQKLLKIENITKNIFEFLDSIKNVEDLWKDYNFWLTSSIFFYSFWNIIQYFDPNYLIKIKHKLDEISIGIKNQVRKWKTNFKLEFVLNISFLIFKEKVEILDYLEDMKIKMRNTKEENSINQLFSYISSGIFNVGILRLMEDDFEISSSIILLFLRFGKKNEMNILKKFIESQIYKFWDKIIKLKNSEEVNSFIRDWLCLRLLQIQLNLVLSSYAVYKVEEIDFFNLSPRNFERLLFWIFKKKKGWKNVQWRGASGSEKGKDILAVKKLNNKNWIIQAKREKNFSRSNFLQEFNKTLIELENYECEGYQIFLARKATDDIYKCGEELERKFKYRIKVKDRSDLNFIIKNNPILLKEFFKYPIKT